MGIVSVATLPERELQCAVAYSSKIIKVGALLGDRTCSARLLVKGPALFWRWSDSATLTTKVRRGRWQF